MAGVMVSGCEFGHKLSQAGFDMPENTTRIVIDAPCDGLVTIYYETVVSKKTWTL